VRDDSRKNKPRKSTHLATSRAIYGSDRVTANLRDSGSLIGAESCH
jgi:hypothetical protein